MNQADIEYAIARRIANAVDGVRREIRAAGHTGKIAARFTVVAEGDDVKVTVAPPPKPKPAPKPVTDD